MYYTKRLKLLLLCWLGILLSLFYVISMVNVDTNKSVLQDASQDSFTENIEFYNQSIEEVNKNYLIYTPGCSIPNYSNTYKIVEDKVSKQSTCGTRAVFIEKLSEEEITFRIDVKMKSYTKGKKYSCCYQFGSPAIVEGKEDYRKQRYSDCINFKNNTKGELKTEVISVTCTLEASKKSVIYEDAYIILKKLNRDVTDDEQKIKEPWNVLILGLDTVSRARVYNSMPKTIEYMLQNDWLDYRAYQKVGYNTFPNVISLLTGKKMSTIYKTCSSGMDHCDHLLLWSQFKKAGYITATGEDDLNLPDTFGKYGYKSRPTDHYIRPLFLTGEKHHGNIMCTKKIPSAKHIIDYASIFTETYKDDNFFGFFWLNSYSHNLDNIPTLIDKDIVNFYSKLNETGILQNTFIYFLSDHGLRSGKLRVPYESYYDERLPMFFLWVPTEFRNIKAQEYNNLKINQHRLITPYDLYLTLYDTLEISKNSTELYSEACPKCKSIFNNISVNRTCEDAGVDDRWCSCHEMVDISHKDDDVVEATNLAVTYVQNKVSTIKTTHCMKCEILKLKKILRSHTYRDENRNNTYYIIALVMSPGDVAYEVSFVKQEKLTILQVNTISVYNVHGRCAIEQNDRAYCVCASSCTKKH